jgi:DHA1 family multidrug resistance protein-like MFS transporter
MGPVLPLFVLALAPTSDRVGTFTGVIVGAEFAVSTLTAVSLGRLGDRIGHAPVAFASAVFAAIFYIPQALAQDVWQLLVLHAVTGVALGGLIPSLSALLARQSRAGDEGCAYGIDSSVAAAGRAVGPLLGASFAVWFSLRGAFVATSGVFALLAIVAAGTVFSPRTGAVSPADRRE